MTEATTVMRDTDLLALRERKRVIDDVWLLTLFVLFLGIGGPWYLRVLDIDFAPVAWSLFGYGVVYLIAASAADRLRSRRSLGMVLVSLQALGVLLIGFVWHLTGSLHNPMLLLAFVLPVVAASLLLMNWQSYAIVILSVITVFTIALIDTPELRWYATQGGAFVEWIIGALPQVSDSIPQPFPGLSAPTSYLFVVLVLFTVLLFAVALLSESVTSLLVRLSGRLDSATQALNQAEDLSSEVLRVSPTPAALVYADTLKIAQASQSFLHHFFIATDSLLDKDLFGLVEFAYPEVIQEIINGQGGEASLAVYRVHGETRMARVRVEPILHGGHRYAYINIQDISDLHYLQAALNAAEDALLVMNSNLRILYFNQAAKELWGALEPGMDGAMPLRQANLPDGWWELGMRTRQERRFELNGKRIIANCIAARIPGEQTALTVLSLRPVRNEQ